jgi:hypothetical protein
MNNSTPLIQDKTLADLEKTHGRTWDRPIFFDEVNTPDISADLLPGAFGAYAKALAHAAEVSEGLVVMTILGVISTALTQRFVVSPKQGWREPVNIYTLMALPPANNKSLVLKECIQPLVDWEQEQKLRHEQEIKRQYSAYQSQVQWIEVLRKKAAKTEDDMTRQNLIEDIAEKESHLSLPKALPILFATDITPETLASQTYTQGGRFALFSDEGGIVETLSGLYQNGKSNIDILLKGIDGGVTRIYRHASCVHLCPLLTIVLAVQPGILQKMVGKYSFTGNGLLERFLYLIPKTKVGYRTHNNPAVLLSIQAAYYQHVHSLLAIPIEKSNAQVQPRVLTLSSSAHLLWKEFQADIEIKLRPEGELGACVGWGGKLAGFSLRLAGLLHLAEGNQESLVISDLTMTTAVTLGYALMQHAIAAYGLMGSDEATEHAKVILGWIQAQGKATFPRYDLSHALRNRSIGKTERLNKSLAVLAERNLIQIERVHTRKPTTILHIHPAVFKTQS